ncbi:MAG: 4'-phosphopantetheinyl transferase superfamily protein [Aureispira sp.]
MPIHYQIQQTPIHLLVWQQTEAEHFFWQALALDEVQQQQLLRKYRHPSARLDWLSSRHALQLLCGQSIASFYKDTAGKLRVADNPFYYSISHSGTFVTAIQAPQTVGVDIQIPNPKLTRIAHKYIAPKTLEMLYAQTEEQQDYLHYYWGIKEALFKAYGKGQVNFIHHLHIIPFEATIEGTTLARLQKPTEETWYKIFYKKTTDYYLCAAVAL